MQLTQRLCAVFGVFGTVALAVAANCQAADPAPCGTTACGATQCDTAPCASAPPGTAPCASREHGVCESGPCASGACESGPSQGGPYQGGSCQDGSCQGGSSRTGSGRHASWDEWDGRGDGRYGEGYGYGDGYVDTRPVGARQVWRYGKPWPPFPRPTGPQQDIAQRYHAAHYWPHPYVCQDRQSVFEHTQAMVQNGWMEQTTLHEYHFNDEEGLLSHAGEAHLRWILFMAPEMHRTVWVQTGLRPHVTDQRIQAVELAAAELLGPDHLPPIMPRVCMPIGTPAEQINTQYRRWIDNVPEPRIQYTPLENQQN